MHPSLSPGIRLLRSMRQRLFAGLVFALAVFTGMAAAAREADPAALSQARQLLQAGRTADALALLDAEVSAAPTDPIARILLVQALVRSGASDRARHHLIQLRATPALSAANRNDLDRLIARLSSAKSHEAWLRFAFVPETNPGQRTHRDTVNVGGLDFTLDPASKAQAATGLEVGFGGAWLPEIASGLRLRLAGALHASLYQRNEINDVTWRAEAGLQGQTARNQIWQAHLSLQERSIGGARYGRAIGVHGTWSQTLGARDFIRLRLDAERWRHRTATSLDGTRVTLSGIWIHALRPDLQLRAAGFATRTNAKAGWETGTAFGLTLGVQRVFEGGLVLGLDISHSRLRRDQRSPLFIDPRKDRRSGITARILHRSVTVMDFAPVLELGLERQTSTIPLNDFRNARMSLAFTRDF